MSALLAGLTLGFSAGISPGPLTSLIITTALARGFGAGLRVAVAPLFTDLPIVAISVLFVSSLPAWVQAMLAVAGGLYVMYLGVETIWAARRASMAQPHEGAPGSADLGKGMIVNLLNPQPWLFWITIGGPLLVTHASVSYWLAASFLAGFYLLLVGSKIALAAAVASGRQWLSDRAYRGVLALSGLLLLFFGFLLFKEVLLPAL